MRGAERALVLCELARTDHRFRVLEPVLDVRKALRALTRPMTSRAIAHCNGLSTFTPDIASHYALGSASMGACTGGESQRKTREEKRGRRSR